MTLKRDGTTIHYQGKRCEFAAPEQAAGFMLSLQKGKPFDLFCRVWLPSRIEDTPARPVRGSTGTNARR